MKHQIKRSQAVYDSAVTTPLGQVSLSAYLRHRHGGGGPAQMRTFGRYALVYLLAGGGFMKWGKQPAVSVGAGDLLFVYPEIAHHYAPGPNQFWSEFFVVFDGPIFDLWCRSSLMQPQNPIRHLPQIWRWLPRLEAVVAPGLPETTVGMVRRVCRLQQFLGDIALEPERQSASVVWLEEAQALLLRSPENTLPDVARKLGLSYETFRKEFTHQTGLAPARYRLHRRIEQARLLIAERHLSNKQVAETLGFYDEFHFSRRFRETTGQNTREFRRNL